MPFTIQWEAMRSAASALFLALALSAPGTASAHDTWIRPLAFRLASGQAVTAMVSSGHGLQAQSAMRRRRFRHLALHPSGKARRDCRKVVAFKRRPHLSRMDFAAPNAGVSCLALSTLPLSITLSDVKTAGYLREIGAPPDVLRAWGDQRGLGLPWVEWYTKHAKAYVRIGQGRAPVWPKCVGLGLELVPLTDPTRCRTNGAQALAVQVLWRGAPLSGLAVRVSHDRVPGEHLFHSEADGLLRLPNLGRGVHLATATHLRLPDRPDGAWHSDFTTLTYNVDRR